jgi:3-phenylpropionate/cinnamic acid dioxygenase small subunit
MSVVTEQAVKAVVFPGPRVVSADPEYMGIVDFLHDEAILLDRDQYVAWTEMLAEDVTYTIPRRKTLDARDGTGLNEAEGIPATFQGLKDLAVRNERVDIYDRNPPVRGRRFVTNIKAYRTEVANEFAVDSYLLFLQSRQDEPTYDMASAERRDILRLTDDGFKLVRRRLIFDQAMMAATLPNVIL